MNGAFKVRGFFSGPKMVVFHRIGLATFIDQHRRYWLQDFAQLGYHVLSQQWVVEVGELDRFEMVQRLIEMKTTRRRLLATATIDVSG